jgi:hypothetical protein
MNSIAGSSGVELAKTCDRFRAFLCIIFQPVPLSDRTMYYCQHIWACIDQIYPNSFHSDTASPVSSSATGTMKEVMDTFSTGRRALMV